MDPLYVQILVLFAFILVTGILIALFICSLSEESMFETLCVGAKPRRKRKTVIRRDGQAVEVEEESTEEYNGPPLPPISRAMEKRLPRSGELESSDYRQPESPQASHGHHSQSHGHHV